MSTVPSVRRLPHVPLNTLARQHAQHSTWLDATAAFLAESRFVHGPRHAQFEEAFAGYCGVKAALGVANGTDAIEIALRAAGVRAGDEVITVANAGFYTSSACHAIGAEPVYADIDAATLTMSVDSAARCVSKSTRALVATHLYGQMAEVETLSQLCVQHGIALIEDCAQAHGAQRRGRKAGAWGMAGTFSFYPTKNLGALGDGGAITTSDSGLADKVRLLRQYGWAQKYESVIPGRNSRLDELQAAFLCVKLPLLDGWNERRRQIVRRYHQAAQGALCIVHGTSGADYVGHLAVARHPAREAARRLLAEQGVETAVHYPLLDHQQPCSVGLSWRADNLCQSERAAAEIFTLPCFAEMTEEELEQVCSALRRVSREIG